MVGSVSEIGLQRCTKTRLSFPFHLPLADDLVAIRFAGLDVTLSTAEALLDRAVQRRRQ